MKLSRVGSIVSKIGYKPNTDFRIGLMGDGWFIQHYQVIADCKESKGTPTEQRGRKFYISPHMTDSEVIQTCLLAVLLFEEHEAREWFTYNGKEIYGPHIDISQKDVRDKPRKFIPNVHGVY